MSTKKRELGKRVTAFITALILAVLSPLSYGGFSLSGLFVNAQESWTYIRNVQVVADNNDVKVSWEYMDDSAYMNLTVGTYGVKVSRNGENPQVIGEIKVSQIESKSGFEVQNARELQADVEPQVIEEVQVAEEVQGDESVQVAVSSNVVREVEVLEMGNVSPTYETVVTNNNTSSEVVFNDAKKIDANYSVAFVKLDEGNNVIEQIDTLEYKAACKIRFEIIGQGYIQYANEQYSSNTELEFNSDNRFLHIVPRDSQWRLEESNLSITGATITKDANESNKYNINQVTDDIVIAVTFIEKTSVPQQDTTSSTNTLSTDVNNPTGFSQSFTFFVKEKENVSYSYTLDGSNPKESITTQIYTKDGILVNDYSKSFAIKMYAKEDGKDASDVVSWYGKIIPEKPIIEGNSDFLEANKIPNTSFIRTDNGDVKFLVPHEEIKHQNYDLYLGILKDTNKQWIKKTGYDAGMYQFLIPKELETGTYQFLLSYQTKGGNFSEEKIEKQEIKIDNSKPSFKKEVFMVLANGQRQKLTSPSWVGNQVEFDLLGTAFSNIKGYEISTDGENFTKIDAKSGKYSLSLEDIPEGSSNYSFRSISYVNHISDATEVFVLKKDTTPPEAVQTENLVISTITNSTEDIGNAIYSDQNISIMLKDMDEKEEGTESKLTVKYRFDQITENATTKKGLENTWVANPIILDKMGRYEFCVWYVDEAGNSSKEYKQELCYDNQDAIISSDPRFELKGDRKETGFANYKFFSKNTLTLHFSAKDEHSGLSRIVIKNGNTIIREQKLNGSTKDTTFEIGVSEEGKYDLNVELYDKAGRRISLSSEVGGFIIDRSEPEIQINSGKAELEWQKEDINFTINAVDNGSGIGRGIVTLNGKAMEQAVNAYQEALTIAVTANEEAENSEGYLLKVEAFNNAGETQTMERKVLLDKTAPEITLGGIEPTSVNQKAPSLSIKVVEKIYNLAEVTLTATRNIDGGTSSYNLGGFTSNAVETTNQYDFPEDGIYEVLVEAKDKAGNQAKQQKIDFTVDTTAPEIEISGPSDTSFHTEDVSVQVKITESFYDTNEVVIKASKTIDGATAPYDLGAFVSNAKVSNMTYRFSEDGTYRIEVSAKDKAGNTSDTKELTFSVDKTAPEVMIEGIENYHVTDQATPLNVSVTESFFASNEVVVNVKREDVTGQTAAFPIAPFHSSGKMSKMNYQFEQEGIYTIMLKATDEAGNTAEMEKILTIDTSSPVINHMEQFDGQYLQSFKLEYSLDEMIQDFTISDYKMMLNGDLYSGEEIIEEGKYIFLVEVTDEVNHRSEASAEFIIDNTSPEIIFIGAEDDKKSYEPISLSIRLSEADDKISKVDINGQQQSLSEDGKTFEKLLDQFGTYVLEVSSVDLAKNSTTNQITVKYTEKPFYLKWYENKPAFYGGIAAGGTAVVGVGITFATIASGGSSSGVSLLKKVLEMCKNLFKK